MFEFISAFFGWLIPLPLGAQVQHNPIANGAYRIRALGSTLMVLALRRIHPVFCRPVALVRAAASSA